MMIEKEADCKMKQFFNDNNVIRYYFTKFKNMHILVQYNFA